MTDPEPLFDALAAHLDRIGEDRAPLFLAKAALALAVALNDNARALALLEGCAHDLERPA